MSGVVVTGAASGIGRACAEVLVADGRSVALWDADPGVSTAAAVLAMPGVVVDVTDMDALEAAVERSAVELGAIPFS